MRVVWCRSSSSLLLLLLQLSVDVTAGGLNRPCIQPVRRRNWELAEDSSVRVPRPIANGTAVASLVSYALLAQDGVSDVILFPASSISTKSGGIPVGEFTWKDAQKLIPRNEPMMPLYMSGQELMDVLEEGDYQCQLRNDACPRVAGIRRVPSPNPSGGENDNQIAQIMSPSCRWKDVEPTRYYQLLTTEDLAGGAYGYSTLARVKHRSSTSGKSLRDIFWYFATSIGVLRDPFRRPIQINPQVIKAQREGRSVTLVSTKTHDEQ